MSLGVPFNGSCQTEDSIPLPPMVQYKGEAGIFVNHPTTIKVDKRLKTLRYYVLANEQCQQDLGNVLRMNKALDLKLEQIEVNLDSTTTRIAATKEVLGDFVGEVVEKERDRWWIGVWRTTKYTLLGGILVYTSYKAGQDGILYR